MYLFRDAHLWSVNRLRQLNTPANLHNSDRMRRFDNISRWEGNSRRYIEMPFSFIVSIRNKNKTQHQILTLRLVPWYINIFSSVSYTYILSKSKYKGSIEYSPLPFIFIRKEWRNVKWGHTAKMKIDYIFHFEENNWKFTMNCSTHPHYNTSLCCHTVRSFLNISQYYALSSRPLHCHQMLLHQPQKHHSCFSLCFSHNISTYFILLPIFLFPPIQPWPISISGLLSWVQFSCMERENCIFDIWHTSQMDNWIGWRADGMNGRARGLYV